MQHSILIVDDQTDILRILEREFRRHGEYSVATANNPTDALQLMEKSDVELIISDVRLGTQTGFSLLQEVNQRHPGVGTMLMTAYRSPAYRQQADALGVSFFLEKPFPVATLVTAVERFFEQRASEAEAQKTPPPPGEDEMNTMAHFKPQDLVQLFCLNGRSVRLALNFDSEKPTGYIYIQRGRVLHAEFGELKAEEAFHALIHESDSHLALQDWNTSVEQTIQSDWELLLLEAARQLDLNNEEETSDAIENASQPTPFTPAPAPALEEPFADFWKIAQMPAIK